MNIGLLGWASEGLRAKDLEVSLGSSPKITLLQMANGTGKTTTLELLRAAMSGAATKWDAEKVNAFKAGPQTEEGSFRIDLSADKNKLTIYMKFNFINGIVKYEVSYGSGKSMGFNLPPELKNFFNEDFGEFFVFDGEMAKQLLDRRGK